MHHVPQDQDVPRSLKRGHRVGMSSPPLGLAPVLAPADLGATGEAGGGGWMEGVGGPDWLGEALRETWDVFS